MSYLIVGVEELLDDLLATTEVDRLTLGLTLLKNDR